MILQGDATLLAMEDVGKLLSHVVPYAILAINTVLFTVSRKFILKVTPSFLTPFIGEILATLELCADCAELGT